MHEESEIHVERESSAWPLIGALMVVVGVASLAYFNVFPTFKEPVVVPATTEAVVPCDHRTPKVEGEKVTMIYSGPGYIHTKNGQIASHCKPCDKAKSAEEKFVCEGDEGGLK